MVREKGICYVALGAEAARSVERRLRRFDPRALREGRLRVAEEGSVPPSLRALCGERPGVVVAPEAGSTAGTDGRDAEDPLGPVGRLAAAVAHELNNPLDGCLRFVQLALDPRTEEADRREFLGRAKEGLVRMAEVVRELLSFARSASLEAREIDLHDLLGQAEAAVRGETGPRVSIATAPGLATVPGGLFSVFTNLLKNALEATSPTGRVEVAARRSRSGRLLVEIRDDGPGIPSAHLRRVFEPFFTTKPEGTGLGLPIARHVARRFGARLLLRSRPGKGTTALVLLRARAGKEACVR